VKPRFCKAFRLASHEVHFGFEFEMLELLHSRRVTNTMSVLEELQEHRIQFLDLLDVNSKDD
jgi:hypothetical protein